MGEAVSEDIPYLITQSSTPPSGPPPDAIARPRMIVGLTGDRGVGKDTTAIAMSVNFGFTHLSFSALMYSEVAQAFGIPEKVLGERALKETPTARLAAANCKDPVFRDLMTGLVGGASAPVSPRRVLQWWATEYRRAQDPAYWLRPVYEEILRTTSDVVVSDVRMPDDYGVIRIFGGMIWRVEGNGVVEDCSHVSEQHWRSFPVAVTVSNRSDIPALMHEVGRAYNTAAKLCTGMHSMPPARRAAAATSQLGFG